MDTNRGLLDIGRGKAHGYGTNTAIVVVSGVEGKLLINLQQ